MFLIGGDSDKIPFDKQKELISELLKRMPVSQSYTRVGLLTPQRVGNDRVDLKFTVNSNTALKQVKAIRKPLSVDIKQTLKNIADMFEEKNGARKNTPNILIAFPNEAFTNELPNHQTPLSDLLASGVKIALVGDVGAKGFDQLSSTIRDPLTVVDSSDEGVDMEIVLEQLIEKLKNGKENFLVMFTVAVNFVLDCFYWIILPYQNISSFCFFHILFTFCMSILDPCNKIKCDYGSVCKPSRDDTASCVCLPCPDENVYSPICGSDGRTYASECSMNVENCKMKKRVSIARTGSCGMTS